MSVAEVVIKQEPDVGECDDTQPMAIPNPVLPTTTHTATHTKSVEFQAFEPLEPQDEGSDKLQTSAKISVSESFLIYELENTGVDTSKCTPLEMLQNAHLSLQNANLALENAHRKITEALPAESEIRTETTTATPTQTKTQITTKPTSKINTQVCRNRSLDETTTHSSTSEKNRRVEMAPIISKETSIKTNMMPIVPTITTTALLSSSSLPPPPTQLSPAQPLTKTTTTELKVKCLCRLEKSTAITPEKTQHLKNFFEQMFDETRQMSRRRQREVKMSLLQAVSMAEEQHDAGQNCAKCCI